MLRRMSFICVLFRFHSPASKENTCRVSSLDQKELRQLNGVTFDRRFVDKASGKDLHRPQLEQMPPLLRKLWREQHPKGHEQTMLDFIGRQPTERPVPLFLEEDREVQCG